MFYRNQLLFGGLFGLGCAVAVAVRELLFSDESAAEAQNQNSDSQPPSHFLNQVGGLAHTHNLIGTCKVGSETAAL